jgi:hypothetical protein
MALPGTFSSACIPTKPTHGIVQKNPFTMSKKCRGDVSPGKLVTSFWKLLSARRSSPQRAVGGAYRDRTDDLKLAKLALSQLS